jgi:hypothetical protein
VKKVYIGLCAILCVLVGATAALAATRTTKSSGVFQARALGQTPQGQTRFTGIIVDKKYGKGVVTFTNTVSGDTVTGTFKAFWDKGTFTGAQTNKLTANPDGTVTISDGQLKVTKGSGAFKRLRGSATYSGTVASDGLTTVNYKTTLRRKK